MKNPTPPMFCDNCSSLSFAEFDGAILCAECLLAAIAAAGEIGLARRVAPIEFMPVVSAEPPGG